MSLSLAVSHCLLLSLSLFQLIVTLILHCTFAMEGNSSPGSGCACGHLWEAIVLFTTAGDEEMLVNIQRQRIHIFSCRNIVEEFLKNSDFTQRWTLAGLISSFTVRHREISRPWLRQCQVSKSHLTGSLLCYMHDVLCANNNKTLCFKFNVVWKNVCVSLVKH